MAVYTEVPDDALATFVESYGLGEVIAFKGIAEGVENSNFYLATDQGQYILTLYEKRVAVDDLPFFVGLVEHLAGHGLQCPVPVRDNEERAIRELCGRPAAIFTFLDGISVRRPKTKHCEQVGRTLGNCIWRVTVTSLSARTRLDCWDGRRCLRTSRLRPMVYRRGLSS